jgi:predicted DCC family thiol-disulfide oxidoreductase YuxK
MRTSDTTDIAKPSGPAGPTDTAGLARLPQGGRPSQLPVRRLTVLYDDQCTLCLFVSGWLGRQRQLVPLEFVPAGSAEARRRLPGLDHGATVEEITVVGDGGQVFRGAAAWIVCLWALREYRRLAHRLSTPAGLRTARGAVLVAAKWRESYRNRGPAARPAARPHPWGGTAYVRRDGWVYDPRAGWAYRGPATAGPGATGAATAGPSGASTMPVATAAGPGTGRPDAASATG